MLSEVGLLTFPVRSLSDDKIQLLAQGKPKGKIPIKKRAASVFWVGDPNI